MISTSSHINKLDALRKYMDVWIAAKTSLIVWESKGGVVVPLNCMDLMLPKFDAWYELYLTTNN